MEDIPSTSYKMEGPGSGAYRPSAPPHDVYLYDADTKTEGTEMDAGGFTRFDMRVVLLACCVSSFITPLLSTMMNLSLVSIGEEFQVGSHTLAYVNTSFLLSSVVFMVPLARGADIIGKRRMFIIGLLTVFIASLLAIVAPSFWFLIALRVMMGAGAAAMSVTSISLITDVFPGNMRGGAIGLHTMCVYVGLAAGPPIGGLLNDTFGWHSLFFAIIPFAVSSLICLHMFRHEITPDLGARFDTLGSVYYGVGITSAMLGVMNLTAVWAIPALAIGVALLVLFVRRQTRIPNRMLNVGLFRNRVFSGSCLAAFLNYAASYSMAYFMALYLQEIGAMTASEAGMMMLTQAAVQAVVTPVFGRLSDKMGNQRILPTVGMAITGLGVSTFLLYGTQVDLTLVMVTMVMVGLGAGMFSSPNTSVIMGSVPRNMTSEASAMVAVMRQAGMMISMGIAMLFIDAVMGGSDNLVPENYGLFVDVIHYSFTICLVMCVIGIVASLMRGSGRSKEA